MSDLLILGHNLLDTRVLDLDAFRLEFLTTVYDAADRSVGAYVKAAAICSILNDWSGMDVEKAVAYILSCQVLYYIQCI